MRIIKKLRYAWQKLEVRFYHYFGRWYQCGCGHATKWKSPLTIHGHEGVFKARSKTPDWCSECWSKAAIKCAWCGETIVPGDPITLYSPGPPTDLFFSSEEPGEAQQRRKQENFIVPDHAVVYREEPQLQLVGCLRIGCVDIFTDRAGFWTMPGKVRLMTLFEELTARG